MLLGRFAGSHGAVAQLVERIVRNDEVGSSNLLRSTDANAANQRFAAFVVCSWTVDDLVRLPC